MLKEGDRAPAFALESDAGEKVTLSSFAGAPVVVYFYPKDSTPGCTREAQAFSAAMGTIKKLGAHVVGISKDSVKSHCSFRDKYTLKIPLLSDPDLTVQKAFGAYGEKSMYGKKVMGTIRSTFVIGADGKIARVFPSVKVDGHCDVVLETLRTLGAGDKVAAKKTAGTATAPKSSAKKTGAKKSAVKPKTKASK